MIFSTQEATPPSCENPEMSLEHSGSERQCIVHVTATHEASATRELCIRFEGL